MVEGCSCCFVVWCVNSLQAAVICCRGCFGAVIGHLLLPAITGPAVDLFLWDFASL